MSDSHIAAPQPQPRPGSSVGYARYTLYYMPGAASFAVHWMLLEVGAPFELIKVDLTAKAQRSVSNLALNTDGRVPVLIVDGEPRAECAALLMILAERHTSAGLMIELTDPRRPAFLQTMFYLANTLQPAFRAWFYADEPAGPDTYRGGFSGDYVDAVVARHAFASHRISPHRAVYRAHLVTLIAASRA